MQEAQDLIVQQQALGVEQAIFYGLCFFLGSAAGLVRTASDKQYTNLWNLVNISMVSGFLSFSAVSILYHWFGSGGGDEPYFLGIASLVGLAGKELQEKLLKKLFKFVSSKTTGITDLEDKDE